jgi:hypothetical protein
MSTMRRIVWFDEQGHKHVTFRSMGDDSTTSPSTIIAGSVPTPTSLPPDAVPASSLPTSVFSSIPTWAIVVGGVAAAYVLFFRKRK